MSIVENFDFTGKTIIITGASSGIGRQTAITLSELGAKLILIARREEQLKETITLLEGDAHKYYLADLKETDKIGNLMKQVVDENGPLDGMVYCAGVAPTRPMKVCDVAFVEDTMKINFFGFYEMTRQFVKKGRYNPNASIVSISSAAGVSSPKGLSIYGASKAAMDNSVTSISKELVEKGININTIQPRMVNTNMYAEFKNVREGGEEYINGRQPGGIIEPVEVAGMVSYLLSPLAKHITGQKMYVGE